MLTPPPLPKPNPALLAWYVVNGKMVIGNEGTTMKVSCMHQPHGSCGSCFARYYMLLGNIERMIYTDAREGGWSAQKTIDEIKKLLEQVNTIIREQNAELKAKKGKKNAD